MSPDSVIKRILELSAEAQIKTRQAAEDFPAFHNLTGAIVAYGKALGLLSKLKAVQQNSLDLDIEKHSMNTNFKVGDVVRHKSGGQIPLSSDSKTRALLV
jgi:hypothetical protein